MEQVFAVETAKLERWIQPGLFKADEKALLALAAKEGKFYDRTPELENNPALKQTIPYVLVEWEGKFLAYQRTKKQADARIHGKISFGFGGHVNPEDGANGRNPILGGRDRELREELRLEGAPEFSFAGGLNANSAPIDAFHLGFVYRARLTNPAHAFLEQEKFVSRGWMTPEQLAAEFDNLESWSQEVFKALHPALVAQKV